MHACRAVVFPPMTLPNGPPPVLYFFFLMIRRPPRSPPFPYTTLFRSATFPSDTLSTHQVQLPGVARLARWGVLDTVLAAGTPVTRDVRFDQGDAVIAGRYPGYQRSEEHTSELQSRLHIVCRLLLANTY